MGVVDEIKYKKLYIPGPVEVDKEILNEMSHFMIGHRTPEASLLLEDTVEKLRKLLFTDGRVFLSTSSSTGIWEATARNCVEKKALSAVMGAFSDKWSKTVQLCEKENERIEVEWGKAVKADQIRAKLEEGNFDALTVVHNETSTGVMSNLEKIAKVMKDFPDVMFLVDAVSSMSAVKIEVDKLGIDCCFAGVQKAFGLPPGLTVFTVSDKAMEKAKTLKNKGYYFNFEVFEKYWSEKKQTPTTPSLSHIFALNKQLDRFFEEGIEKRFARHAEMADYVRNWAVDRGFELFAEEGYRSQTVTTIVNNKGLNISEINKKLAEKQMMISNGYGPMKEKNFRIAHMADFSIDDVKQVTTALDELLSKEGN